MTSARSRFALALMLLFIAATTAPTTTTAPAYTECAPSPDGIGKVYMGREIAHVMGHEGAEWLERPEREAEERIDLLVDNMGLKETDVVADIGAGTGRLSFLMSPKVPKGKVLAEDIQPEMLELVKKAAAEKKVTNVETVLGTIQDPMLPAGEVDAVLMVDAYHEFDHPREMMEGIVRGLKPGGRVILVEYRGEDPKVPIKPHHKMTQAQAKKEMGAVGLKHVETKDVLPWQHLMIFEKAR